MIFLWIAVAAAWCFFWLKGQLWAGLIPAVLVTVLELFSYKDQGHFDGIGIWIEILVILAVGVAPYAIRWYRAEKADRLLNGVRFNYRD